MAESCSGPPGPAFDGKVAARAALPPARGFPGPSTSMELRRGERDCPRR